MLLLLLILGVRHRRHSHSVDLTVSCIQIMPRIFRHIVSNFTVAQFAWIRLVGRWIQNFFIGCSSGAHSWSTSLRCKINSHRRPAIERCGCGRLAKRLKQVRLACQSHPLRQVMLLPTGQFSDPLAANTSLLLMAFYHVLISDINVILFHLQYRWFKRCGSRRLADLCEAFPRACGGH